MRFVPIVLALLSTLTLVIALPLPLDKPVEAKPAEAKRRPHPRSLAYTVVRPPTSLPDVGEDGARAEYSRYARRFATSARKYREALGDKRASDSDKEMLKENLDKATKLQAEYEEKAKQAAALESQASQ
jgi:hypothetical protein